MSLRQTLRHISQTTSEFLDPHRELERQDRYFARLGFYQAHGKTGRHERILHPQWLGIWFNDELLIPVNNQTIIND